jgi:hypothetical protein
MHIIITIIIAGIPTRPSYYTARCDGLRLCSSGQPLLDGARALLASGFSAHTVIELRHVGSDAVAMRAVLGVAACLTVSANRASRPVFHCRKATKNDATASPVRSNNLPASHPLEAAE